MNMLTSIFGTNWRTTLFGAIAMAPQAAKALWPDMPHAALDLLTAVAGFIAFAFAKDHNVTGGTTAQ